MIVGKVFVPSMPESVYRALHDGLTAGLTEIKEHLLPAVEKVGEDRESYLAQCRETLRRIESLLATSDDASDPVVSRFLKKDPV